MIWLELSLCLLRCHSYSKLLPSLGITSVLLLGFFASSNATVALDIVLVSLFGFSTATPVPPIVGGQAPFVVFHEVPVNN